MTQESSKTGGPGGPTVTSDLLRMIDSQLSTLTGIQENLTAGLQQVTLLTRELHGFRRLVEAGTSTTNITAEPSDKPRESISKEDSSTLYSLHPLDISGAENQDPRGEMRYDGLGNPYWVYFEDDPWRPYRTLHPDQPYRQFLRHLRTSLKTT